MPTEMHKGSSTLNDDVLLSVFYTMLGLRSPRMRTIDPSTVSANALGQKILPAGTVIVDGNGAGTGLARAYPGSKATAAAGTGVDKLTVVNASVFKVGDALVKGTGAGTSIGTVAAISGDEITLSANLAAAVALGDPIYVAGITSGILGIISAPHNLADSNDVACYSSASVYRDRLPFWDANIAAALPEITLCP